MKGYVLLFAALMTATGPALADPAQVERVTLTRNGDVVERVGHDLP